MILSTTFIYNNLQKLEDAQGEIGEIKETGETGLARPTIAEISPKRSITAKSKMAFNRTAGHSVNL